MAVQPEGSVHEGICVWEHGGDRMALAWVHVQPVGERGREGGERGSECACKYKVAVGNI